MKKCTYHWMKPHANCVYCYSQAASFDKFDGGALDAYLAGDQAYVQAAQMGFVFVGTR